jgi:hypothetical protein
LEKTRYFHIFDEMKDALPQKQLTLLLEKKEEEGLLNFIEPLIHLS